MRLSEYLQLRLPNPPNLRLAGHLRIMLALRVRGGIFHGSAGNLRLGLLVDDEPLRLGQSVQGLALDAVHQVVARGDVVDQADDLAGGPDLGSLR